VSVIAVDPHAHPNSPTSGIQEAVDALPPGGGTVFIPAGTYPLRGPVVCKPNVTLRGEGEATALTRGAPVVHMLADDTEANKTAFVLDDASGLSVGDTVWVRDFHQGGWHSRFIVIRAIEGNRLDGDLLYGDIERVYPVKDHPWAANLFPAIYLYEASGVTVASLTIDGGDHEYDPERAGDFVCAAIHSRNSADVRVRDVTVRRWPGDGIGLQGGNGTVTGCVVEKCLGIGLHPGTGIEHSVWAGNISRENRHGLLFCQSVQNTVVAQNVILRNREHGIWGLGAPDRYNVVAGNICAENGWYGIEGVGAKGNAIVGNVCRSNSRAMPGNYSGILLQKHTDNLVVGNVCVDDLERPTQLRGIETVEPAGPNLVESNHAVSYSGYMRAWEPMEEKHAEHMAEHEHPEQEKKKG